MKKKIINRIAKLILSMTVAICAIGMIGCTQPEPPHVHTFSEAWTTDATSHWHAATCEHTTEVSGKADHQFPETWKLVTAATEEAAGLEERFCEVCNYRATQVIPQLNHIHDIAKVWSTDSTKHWHAASCGREEHNEDVAEHTEDSGTVTKDATYKEEGVRIFKCKICDKEIRTEVIPTLELTEINKNGWLIKISNVAEGVKFEITKPITVKSLNWAAIDKVSNDASEIYEATGVLNRDELIKDIGTSTFIFPFVNPNENTKLHIKIESNVGVLDENLYIKTSGGMGCPDYTNALPSNNIISVNIDKDKMNAVIEKFEIPDFSNVKLQIEPVRAMVELYKYEDWGYLTGEYKDGWEETNFDLADASEKIPIGESKIRINHLRAFKIVGDTSYDKYYENFRMAGLSTTVDISSMYLSATDMWVLRGRKYKAVEKYTRPILPDGAESYLLVKFSDSATGFSGVTGGAIIDFSKVADIETKWNSIKSNYMNAEIDDAKYTVILWNPNEDSEETLKKRNCKGLSDLSMILFTDNDINYTAVPF